MKKLRCRYRRKPRNVLKGYIYCRYFGKVYSKDTCNKCHKEGYYRHMDGRSHEKIFL